MVEVSEQDLARLENEFNSLRAEVYVFRALLAAMMINTLESRESAPEFLAAIRAQTHTGLMRAFKREHTPERLRDFQRTALNGFFDQVAEQLDISETSEDRSGPS